MGGNTWSSKEEEVFWKRMMPNSPKRVGIHVQANPEKTWAELAEDMKRAMGTDARREYSSLGMSEHFFTNAVLKRFSPNAHRHVQQYFTQMGPENGKPLATRKRPSARHKAALVGAPVRSSSPKMDEAAAGAHYGRSASAPPGTSASANVSPSVEAMVGNGDGIVDRAKQRARGHAKRQTQATGRQARKTKSNSSVDHNRGDFTTRTKVGISDIIESAEAFSAPDGKTNTGETVGNSSSSYGSDHATDFPHTNSPEASVTTSTANTPNFGSTLMYSPTTSSSSAPSASRYGYPYSCGYSYNDLPPETINLGRAYPNGHRYPQRPEAMHYSRGCRTAENRPVRTHIRHVSVNNEHVGGEANGGELFVSGPYHPEVNEESKY